MRNEFHESLDALTVDLADMCGRAAELIQTASAALLDGDEAGADRALFEMKRLTRLGNAVQERTYGLLALQAPVARDLRTLVSALYIASDADRMGGLAAHIARTARRRLPERVIPEQVYPLFADMAYTATELAQQVRGTVSSGDPEQARRVCEGDERMNELHRELFAQLIGPHWQHGAMVAADLVLVGRFYERFADHCVEIARRVYFRATGEQLCQADEPPPVGDPPMLR
ncbi:phosphate transport system regulatory protein PhoU [Mycolicibacterium parafortuitum]|uniref:phosphate signaling complex protein PhoU n=1 Tax=Mycolicibacterium parafortuitum TaxID=39692 RepID=UPI0032C4432E